MLARVLAMALCPCPCLSVTSRCFIETVGRNNLVFGMGGGFFRPVLHCVLRKFSYLQNKGTYLWNCFLNSGLRKFRHGISIVERAINLARQGRSLQAYKLDRRLSTKLIIPPSSDARPVKFIAQIVKLSLQHDFVARVSTRY